MNTKRSATGGFPGFRFLNGLTQLWTQGMTAQAEAMNEMWDHVRSKPDYQFGDWARDISSMWERSFTAAQQLLMYPARADEEDRPAWVCLAWNKDDPADVVPDEVALGRAVVATENPVTTQLEKLGTDPASLAGLEVKATLNSTGDRLTVSVSGLAAVNPPPGHYVGFVTIPSLRVPIAIVFLTVLPSKIAAPRSPPAAGGTKTPGFGSTRT